MGDLLTSPFDGAFITVLCCAVLSSTVTSLSALPLPQYSSPVLAGETSSQPLVHPHSRLRPSSACFLCCGPAGFPGCREQYPPPPPSQVGGRQRPTGMLPTSGGLCAADSCSVHQRGTWGERELAGHVLDDGSDLDGSPRQWAAPDNQLDESDRHSWREA